MWRSRGTEATVPNKHHESLRMGVVVAGEELRDWRCRHRIFFLENNSILDLGIWILGKRGFGRRLVSASYFI
ncbi:hypothetical protein SLEP1_g28725 [Rubroshorea leprosula]|uniref:Uncharacterized protein n=1 Tax=Rubroshorea leprosula TaxID=152421 RepID=A0AAV5K0P8_9ROSI|nr:hypothetical protein SLEP1_g28725 [Rubroshorea leprosula]